MKVAHPLFLAFKAYFPLLVFALVAFALFNNALDGNWRWDDSAVLSHITTNGSFTSFYNGNIYRQFSSTNLFPWILFSYNLDYRIFDNQPAAFYAHQLVAIYIATICLYLVARQWMRSYFAALTGILFLVGTPIAVISEQLMTRHYIEGLIFALLAILTFTSYIRSRDNRYLVVSAMSYLIAITCKEIYVPLVLFLPVIPGYNFKHQYASLVPFLAIVILYMVWRVYMLDTLFGGYASGQALAITPYILEVSKSYLKMPVLLFQKFSPIIIVIWLSLFCLHILKHRIFLFRAVVASALILGPLLPLVITPGINSPDRYLLLVWLAFAFSTPYFAQSFIEKAKDSSKPLYTAILTAVLTAVILMSYVNSQEYLERNLEPIATEYDVHSEFITHNDEHVAYIPGPTVLANYWFIAKLEDLLISLNGSNSIPVDIVDDSYLTRNMTSLYQYDPACQCMQDITNELDSRIRTHQARLRQNEPLSLMLAYSNHVFSWKFGPYELGEFHLVSSRLGAFPLPAEGSQRVSIVEDVPFVLRYTSPQGWQTYSPELVLSPNGEPTVWKRF